MKEIDRIEIRDAQENNLRHVDVDIPKGQLVVLAGVSGSVKTVIFNVFKDIDKEIYELVLSNATQ